jgi:uncharacterized membrane protein
VGVGVVVVVVVVVAVAAVVAVAVAIVVVATFISYKYTTSANVFEMVIVWLTFACICLGLVTIPELLKDLSELKNGSKKAPTNEGENSH